MATTIDGLIEKYKNKDDALRSYHAKHNDYLNMPREVLRTTHPADLAEINFELAKYAYFLQRTWNEHTSLRSWCESQIKVAILQQLEESDIWAYEHKKIAAIQKNDYAAKLYNLQTLASLEADRLYLMADRVKQVIYAIAKFIEVKLSQK